VLSYGRQLIEADDIEAVVRQLKGDWLTQGPRVAQFEERLCELTGARYAVVVSSGTAALHLATLAAGLQSGDTGITADMTFVASANCMRYAGARPVLVDIDPQTGHLSMDALNGVVTELVSRDQGPKLIVPVDFSGSVGNLEALRTMADAIGAVVIEDAAHSLGATYTGTDGQAYQAASCRHTHMAVLSFHPVKHITTGEGGAILTRDEGVYKRLKALRSHGITKDGEKLTRVDGPWYYEQHSLGFNYRLTDLQCALGISQARKLARFVARRRALAAQYDRHLARAPYDEWLSPLKVPPGSRSSYHLYVIRLRQRSGDTLEAVSRRRRLLYDGLRARGIGPQVHYIPLHRQPDFQRAGLSGGTFSGAEAYYAGCLSLPMFPGMHDGDVDRVVDALGDILTGIQL